MKNRKIHNFPRKNVCDLIYRQLYTKLKSTGNINYADKSFVSYEALCICHLFSPCDPAISESIRFFKFHIEISLSLNQRVAPEN